jgi:uncharacterized protein (UPF0332 family)
VSQSFLDQAHKSLRAARFCAESDDAVGAADRAYYAAFDAARHVLEASAGIDVRAIRTHNGLWKMFFDHVVAPGLIEAGLTRGARRAEQHRLSAVYAFVELDDSEVADAIDSAQRFVEACAALVEGRAP